MESARDHGPWLTPMRRVVLEVAAGTLFGVLWPERMAIERRRQASIRGVARTALINTASWYVFEGRRAMTLISRGPGGREIVERVRASVKRTCAEGTAALGYVPWVAGSISWSSQERLGRIDFLNERSVYAHADDGWMFLAPGLVLEGEPGAWHACGIDSEVLSEDDPFWLLALSEGRIRRARLHQGRAVTRMELLNFGDVPPIDVPSPGELLSDDDV
jgi:hypothetical protein